MLANEKVNKWKYFGKCSFFFTWKGTLIKSNNDQPYKKCPTGLDNIEKWKNSTTHNYVTPSLDDKNHSCIIGSVDEKIVFQVRFEELLGLI